MFHCEASLLEDVDDVAVDDARHFFFFFLHDELYNVGKKRCVQEDMYTIGGKMRIRRG